VLGGGGSSSTATESDSATTGLPTDQVAGATDTAAAASSQAVGTDAAATGAVPAPATALVSVAPPVPRATVLAMRRLPATDPFVPLLGETTLATAPATGVYEETPASAPASPDTSVAATPPAPAAAAPPSSPSEAPTAKPGTAKPDKPAVVPVKVPPTVAVIKANGNRQAVGVSEYFKVADVWFQLLALTPKTMKISVVDGVFASGKPAITIRLDRPITLVNTATGVEYSLRLTRATTGIETTSHAEPVTAAPTDAPVPDHTTEPTPADAAATAGVEPTPESTTPTTPTTPSGS
jgi:hypothetical protein